MICAHRCVRVNSVVGWTKNSLACRLFYLLVLIGCPCNTELQIFTDIMIRDYSIKIIDI